MTVHHPLAAIPDARDPQVSPGVTGMPGHKPIALAMVLCLFSLAISANEAQTQANADISQPTRQALSPQSVSYPYLNWYPRTLLEREQQQLLPEFCSGLYRSPTIQPLASDVIVAEADEAQLDKNGNAFLRGDVEMQRDNYLLKGDTVNWQQQQGSGQFVGNVSIYTPWSTLHSEEALFSDQGSGNAANLSLQNAAYSLPEYHMRGEASTIETRSNGKIRLRQASMTFCEPGQNDWDIVASSIQLDQQRGIGSAWHTRLRVMDVPIIYLPYYRFPIDDRRTSGFLDPSFSLNGNGQLEDLQTPFYLNLAPNLDATITPHHILDRGFLWESQLRHKTALLGEGELNYGYMNQDKTEDDERWLVNYSQQGQWGQHWSHSWVYNHVSDNDYLTDLNSASGIDRSTHLPRRGQIRYQNNHWQAELLIEGFQTIDDSLTLSERPYQRLPQLSLSYQNFWHQHLQIDQTLQVARFRRQQSAYINGAEEQLTGFDGLFGQRLVSDTHVSWRKNWSSIYIQPSVDFRYRQYQLGHDNRDTLDADQPMSLNYGVPRYQFDAGLVLERSLTDTPTLSGTSQLVKHTLEPRILWVKSPYKANQTQIPTFDSGNITTDYQSLFSGDRFSGYDRLADLDQISLGVTSRLLNNRGNDYLNVSLGRIYYQHDRQVVLDAGDEVDNQATSTAIGEINWFPTPEWQLYHTLEWDTYDDFTRQKRFGLRYNDDHNHMISLSNHKVQSIDTTTGTPDTDLHQLDVSAFWSLSDRWALMGRILHDQNSYQSDEQRPASSTLEALAGFEYQNCCWRLQVMYRETSPTESDLTASNSTDSRHSLMFSIQLKGLSTLGGGTDSILSQSINGYSRRQYHDY